MNYRLKDSNPRPQARTVRWVILGSVALIALALRIFLPTASSQAVQALLSPFMRGSSDALRTASNIPEQVIKSKSELAAENSELRAQVADAERTIALSRNLEIENAELRTVLGITQASKQAAALVIANPPESPYDSLVIEFGSGASVAEGDRVYADGDILLGEIEAVSGTTATAKLYSTAGSELDATIERNNIAQKAVGTGGGNFEIKAPKEVDVVVGDTLVIPGLSKKILGIVRRIDTEPTDSFQHVLVASPVNIFQLKWVTIEKTR